MTPDRKHCSSCGRSYDVGAVVCVPCEVVFEEAAYLRWIWVASALALVAVGLMTYFGILERFSISEAFKISAALLLLLYPLAKVVQKARDPRRPVLREMGSVFSGRFDRALVLALLLFAVLTMGGGLHLPLRSASSLAYRPIRFAVDWFVTLVGLASVVAIIIDQGTAFFDFRIRNTYVERYRHRASL
jgi:hypothetical protein